MADNVSVIADEDGDFSDWIEVHNPGAAAVDMTNWALTDDAGNLTKWKFPAVTMQPGDFLVVWASSKNKRVPGAPLHTNFSLAKSGEYLALVQPNGTTIEQQFAPAFPAMAPNESYGLQFTTTTFVAAGASARYLVATSSTPAVSAWTTPAFNANAAPAWGTGATGIGFGLLVPGITVRQVVAARRPMAASIVWRPPPRCSPCRAIPRASPSQATITANTMNFLGDGGDAHYGNNLTLPVGTGEPYAILATGYVQIPTTGVYTFGLNSDDGGRIKIDGNAGDDRRHESRPGG